MIEEPVQIDQQEIADPSLLRVWKSLPAWIDRHHVQVLLLILLFALILGMVRLRIDPPSPEFNWENRWWQIALNVARGEGYIACKPIYFPFCGPTNQVTAMREPLPVLLFALIAILTNESLLVAAASGIAANLAVLIAVFFLARELAGNRAGVLASLLWAVYLPPIRLYYSQISGDLLATLGITCGLFYYLRARRTDRRWDWLAAGVWIGLAILSRSAVIVVAMALTICLVFWPHSNMAASQQPRTRKVKPLALFTLAWVLIVSPWLIRNYIAFGQPVLGSTLSGYYLYRQNYMLQTENYLRFVSGGEFYTNVLQEMVVRRTDLQGTENEAQMDQIYRQEALQNIRAEPIRYIQLSAYRFFMLWFNWRVNEVYGKPDTRGDYVTIIQHLLLLIGGGIGMIRSWQRTWPFAVTIAVFSLLYMAVMAHLPYIVPVVPLLVVLSALAIEQVRIWLPFHSSLPATRRGVKP